MNCRKWKLVAVGLALLCGACGQSAGTVPSPTAVPVDPAVLPAATGQVVAAPVPTYSNDQRCSPTESSSGPYCDREVLLAARDVLRGANTKVLRTWQRDRPLGSFEGVRVDPSSGRVVKIEDAWLTSLVGSIPPELGQLGHLQELDLRHNQLTGSIPPELGQLSHLQELDLGHNWLTGSIPPELGRLGHLQGLELDRNRLTGSIPPELGRLGHLQELNVSSNQLTGSIPPELGQLGHLQVLELDRNRLTGSIPSELGQLCRLEWLSLGHNRLTGSIPPILGQLGHLQGLELSHNLLTGPVPVTQGLQLQKLDLTGNRFAGHHSPGIGTVQPIGYPASRRRLHRSGGTLGGTVPYPAPGTAGDGHPGRAPLPGGTRNCLRSRCSGCPRATGRRGR